VLKATLSRAVSEDPLLFFRIKGGQAEDSVRVSWVDSWGERRVSESVIKTVV
jgi:hypothetical protein